MWLGPWLKCPQCNGPWAGELNGANARAIRAFEQALADLKGDFNFRLYLDCIRPSFGRSGCIGRSNQIAGERTAVVDIHGVFWVCPYIAEVAITAVLQSIATSFPRIPISGKRNSSRRYPDHHPRFCRLRRLASPAFSAASRQLHVARDGRLDFGFFFRRWRPCPIVNESTMWTMDQAVRIGRSPTSLIRHVTVSTNALADHRWARRFILHLQMLAPKPRPFEMGGIIVMPPGESGETGKTLGASSPHRAANRRGEESTAPESVS